MAIKESRRLTVIATAIALVVILASCLPNDSDDNTENRSPAGAEAAGDVQALWLATGNAPLRIRLDTEDIRPAPVSGADRTVVSVRAGRFYAAAGTRLTGHDLDTTDLQLRTGTRNELRLNRGRIVALAAGDDGQSVWIVRQSQASVASIQDAAASAPVLIALNPRLERQWEYPLPAPVLDVVAVTRADSPTAIWVLHGNGVTGLSANGEETVTLSSVALSSGSPRSLAVIPILGEPRLWVATASGVHAFNPQGQILGEVRLQGVRKLRADGEGGAWAVTAPDPDGPHRLIHLASGLVIDARLDLASLGYPMPISAAVADPRDASLWLTAGGKLLHAFPDSRLKLHADLSEYLGTGRVTDVALYVDTLTPKLALEQPEGPLTTKDPTQTLVFSYDDPGLGIDPQSLVLTRGGKPFAVACEPADTEAHTVTCRVGPLEDDRYTLQATITDRAGNQSAPVEVMIEVDTVAPTITLEPPLDDHYTNADTVVVAGRLSETARLTIDGQAVELNVDRGFRHPVAFTADGSRTMALTAIDKAGNRTTRTITLYHDTVAPAQPPRDRITVEESGTNGVVRVESASGTVEANADVIVTNTRTGASVTVSATEHGAFVAMIEGNAADTFEIIVADRAGNRSDPLDVGIGTGDIPPDPADVAPSLTTTGITPFSDRVSFLYQGNNPIQTGVAPETIEARRVSILRGSVHNRAGQPLPGVEITVLNHPELGATRTRADGLFDMAVNGGGVLTVVYRADGYLPVQRTLDTQWNGWYHADPVVMIPLDDKVTTVDLTSDQPMQVARGSLVEDAAGPRRATLMFPRGTTATITTPDGGSKQLSQLDVRMTEYTVGPSGPAAMPGELPPASAYTYAVELSVDQVVEQGIKVDGKGVVFNQPIPFYVDNFLEFPTGEPVPVGYYNGEAAAWVPYPNGRIIEVLSEEAGVAILDVTGSGNVATPTELTELGITTAERTQLARLYEPGDSLWRVALTHLSTWDCNWPYGPPRDAEDPDVDSPDSPANDQEDSDEENECEGCSINPQQQSVGEEIPIAGTPFSLHYQSSRAPGSKQNRVTIPLTDGDVPDSLRAVELDITIAGRRFSKTFSPATNQSYTFSWDGLDAFGRKVFGTAQARITLSYVYGCVYYGVSGDNSFGRFGDMANAIGSKYRCRGFRFSRKSIVTLASPTAPPLVGNWSLSIEHRWYGASRILLRGDGQRRVLTTPIIGTVAGTGKFGFSGDGGPATDARLSLSRSGIAIGPDGSLYVADSGNNRIRRVAPNGIITTVAGTGEPGFSGDGGPATDARLEFPQGIAIGLDGSLYIADTGNHRIRRVTPNGIITTVAGSGATAPHSYDPDELIGDGGPATEAELYSPRDIAVGPDGSLYIADTNHYRIRRIGPDRVITTVVGGGGTLGAVQDGILAKKANLYNPRGIAIDAGGNLYVANTGYQLIHRLESDGTLTIVAGSGSRDFFGDGGPATEAAFYDPEALAIGPDGSMYIADTRNSRVRRVSPNGIISTVVGSDPDSTYDPTDGDGGPATEAELISPQNIAIGPQGSLFIADGNRIRRVTRIAAYLTLDGGIIIPSTDGIRAFAFNAAGRHLRTKSTRTGAILYEFTHDDAGYLIAVTDGNGNTTTIQRDSSGRAIAIIAPDGQRTDLLVDNRGHLTQVADPTGGTWTMSYTPDGLLTRFTDRSGSTNTFTYNELGRLIRDTGPQGSGWTLARTELDDGYRVEMTSGAGRRYKFKVERPQEGLRHYTNTAPDGTITELKHTDAGDTTIELPSGTTITRSEGPDPRFGVQARFVERATVATPSGLERVIERDHEATGNELLSPEQLTRSITINGRTTESIFDGQSRTWTITTAEDRQASLAVDALNRPLTRRIADLAPVSFVYDNRGRPASITQGLGENQRSYQLTYHIQGTQAGYLRSVTDPLNRVMTFEHDANGRVTQQILPGGRTIGYQYDPAGRLIALTPPGRSAHVFSYNRLDQRSSYVPPNLDGIETITRYTYNADKQLTAIERPGGATVTLGYDFGGRLSERTMSAGTTAYGYNSVTGQLSTIAAPGGIALAFAYDGFLPSRTTWSGPIAGTVGRGFDDNFWLIEETVGTQPITFSYDADGLLTEAGALTLTRDPNHGLVSASDLNAVDGIRTYNTFGELSERTVTVAGNDLYSVAFTRDALGRITTETETLNGVTHTWGYAYNSAGRLKLVIRDGVAIHLYSYDPNGNRTRHNGPTGSDAGTYDAQDRLLTYGGASYTHTPSGQRATRTSAAGTTSYSYDAAGNLRQVIRPDGTTIEYLIDGLDRRVGKKVDGTLVKGWLYRDRLNPVAQLDASGTITQRYVYAAKSNVPAYMIQNGTTYRIVSDHLGSVRLVINAEMR